MANQVPREPQSSRFSIQPCRQLFSPGPRSLGDSSCLAGGLRWKLFSTRQDGEPAGLRLSWDRAGHPWFSLWSLKGLGHWFNLRKAHEKKREGIAGAKYASITLSSNLFLFPSLLFIPQQPSLHSSYPTPSCPLPSFITAASHRHFLYLEGSTQWTIRSVFSQNKPVGERSPIQPVGLERHSHWL